MQEIYKSTEKIQFGVQKEEPLRAQAKQFVRFLNDGDAGELCTGREALVAVLLTERAVHVDERRTRPGAPPAPPAPMSVFIHELTV